MDIGLLQEKRQRYRVTFLSRGKKSWCPLQTNDSEKEGFLLSKKANPKCAYCWNTVRCAKISVKKSQKIGVEEAHISQSWHKRATLGELILSNEKKKPLFQILSISRCSRPLSFLERTSAA